MGLIEKIIHLFRPGTDLSKIYTASMLPRELPEFHPYPRKDFLGVNGVYAYRVQFMAAAVDAESVLGVIRDHFKIERFDVFQAGSARNDKGESIHFSIHPEFNGAVVELVSNSIPFFESLDKLGIQPPPPWVAFPEIVPDALGSLQGSIDYWWTWYWEPFWETASDEEKTRYLVDNHASPQWSLCIKAHQP